MKKIIILFLGFTLVLASCSNRKVSRIDPSETPDISGSWNNTDSRLTAEEMIKQSSDGKK